MHAGITFFHRVVRVVITLRAVELGNFLHLFVRQGKIKDVKIRTQMLWILRARNRHDAVLNGPAQDNLNRALMVFGGEVFKNRFMQQTRIAVSERIPAHELRAVFLEAVHLRMMSIVRMRLKLDDMWLDISCC